MNMPTETFLATLYTIVDDWYQRYAPHCVVRRVGTKPTFSDSEVMTLAITQHWLGIPDEREFLRVLRNNFLPPFPRLVSQGQFNRRARNLCWLIHTMRQHLVAQVGVQATPCQLIREYNRHTRPLFDGSRPMTAVSVVPAGRSICSTSAAAIPPIMSLRDSHRNKRSTRITLGYGLSKRVIYNSLTWNNLIVESP
jgi:hypothetical protein